MTLKTCVAKIVALYLTTFNVLSAKKIVQKRQK